jgi:activator-of-BECN1-regulated-autophagy protein 1
VADRPIASIAFHGRGEILAVASGHKVRLAVLTLKSKKKNKVFLYCLIESVTYHTLMPKSIYMFLCQLYIWNYNKKDDASFPAIILKTRRSLRAVHFHPHGAPYLLTAEVEI